MPEWADRVGVLKFTACRWFRVGTSGVPAGAGGAGDDVVRDMAGVLTWFCAGLYRRRGARDRAVRAPGCARGVAAPAAAGP